MDEKNMREFMDQMLAGAMSELGTAARRPDMKPSTSNALAGIQESLYSLQNRTNPPKLDPMDIPELPRVEFIAAALKDRAASDRATPGTKNGQERKARAVAANPIKPVCTAPLSELEQGERRHNHSP